MKSILTKYQNNCAFCGRPTEADHHLVFGIGLRKLSEEDGLKLPSCNNCHNMAGGKNQLHGNPVAEALSKMLGQMAWEKQKIIEGHEPTLVRDEFRRRYGQSYL